MATPPLPDVSTVRVRLDYTYLSVSMAGSRFYLSYSGSAPSGGDCATLAGDIAAAWTTHYAPLVFEDFVLSEVEVLDITSGMGADGFWTGTDPGSRAGTPLPAQIAMNIEFNIAQRYRGGKPRIYMPPGVYGDTGDLSHWTDTYQGLVQTGIGDFFTEIEALTVGSMGTLAHIVLSYYHGYNTASPPWRGAGFRYPPKYRSPNALHYNVAGYAPKLELSSQKRRRVATTP
jgi:hypothetical protein